MFLALLCAWLGSGIKPLARRTGYAPHQLRDWLNGRRVPRRSTQARLRAALEV